MSLILYFSDRTYEKTKEIEFLNERSQETKLTRILK